MLEMEGGDGCPTLWMYLMPLNCTLKNGIYVAFKKRYVLLFKEEIRKELQDFYFLHIYLFWANLSK